MEFLPLARLANKAPNLARDDSNPTKKEVIMYKRKCEDCNKAFESLVPWARYCGDACKQRAYRRRKAHNEPVKQIQPAATGKATTRGRGK